MERGRKIVSARPSPTPFTCRAATSIGPRFTSADFVEQPLTLDRIVAGCRVRHRRHARWPGEGRPEGRSRQLVPRRRISLLPAALPAAGLRPAGVLSGRRPFASSINIERNFRKCMKSQIQIRLSAPAARSIRSNGGQSYLGQKSSPTPRTTCANASANSKPASWRLRRWRPRVSRSSAP